ncbi:GNAT family N-acetyltransferase [Paenibacillus filicis]|uniref:GNAT family N-acetyltransferase n=1 Tax=Paenibacillus filicis TaxID=669464 RepID=A0ABU9DPH7_9BACL
MPIVYRLAETQGDMEQIFRLNYKTFVEEIPQHAPHEDRVLVDRFHAENTYVIAVDGERLAGMLAVRDRRPFSLDTKVTDLEELLPFRPKHMIEIRLLAIDRAYRGSRLLYGLIRYLDRYMEKRDFEMAVISGTTRELKLYKHLGFIPFGGLVGSEQACYQPMYMTPASYEASGAYALLHKTARFTAGPVEILPEVTRALLRRPVSHRSGAFRKLYDQVRSRLLAMTGARAADIWLGSGTLANDAVAGELSRMGGRGLVLASGEFGYRLMRQAERWQLDFDAITCEYGRAFDYAQLEAAVGQGSYAWLWAVHGETSTGVLQDLERLKGLTSRHGVALALDCISSLGAVPLSLQGVRWATGVSGKALGSYTGLSFVLYGEAGSAARVGHDPEPHIPPYLDAALYRHAQGIPFSHSSNLLAALDAALAVYERHDPYAVLAERGERLRASLSAMGLQVLAEPGHETPYIVTIVLPAQLSSHALGEHMADQGFELQYESEYLRARNWVQIACMGALRARDMASMLEHLEGYVSQAGVAAR